MDRLKLLDAGLRAFDTTLPSRGATALCGHAVPGRLAAVSASTSVPRRRSRRRSGLPSSLSAVPRAAPAPPCARPARSPLPSAMTPCASACGGRRRRARARSASRVGRWARSRFRCGRRRAAGAGTAGAATEEELDAPFAGEPTATRVVVPCLGGLAAADLIAAAALGFVTVELLSGDCAACVDAAAGASAAATLAVAAETLDALGVHVACSRRSVPGLLSAAAPAMTAAGTRRPRRPSRRRCRGRACSRISRRDCAARQPRPAPPTSAASPSCTDRRRRRPRAAGCWAIWPC